MNDWRTQTENWLAHEASGHEAHADTAFAALLAALPATQPSGDFVRRTVMAAARARGRRRWAIALGTAAAAIGAVGAGTTAYGLLATVTWPLTMAAWAGAGWVGALLAVAATSVEWWAAMVQVGRLASAAVEAPGSAALLLLLGLIGAAALSGLQRLLRSDIPLRRPGPLYL